MRKGLGLPLLLCLAISLAISFPHEESASEEILQPKKIELREEAVSKKVLENGLTILVKESPPRDLVSITIKIEAGSSLEGEWLGSGISHFVEHMVFKGTRTRNAGEIEKEIRSYGGFINGSVTRDLTDIHVTLPAQYFQKALSLLHDMVTNSVFDKKEVEKEREVILKEISMHEDEPQSLLLKRLYEAAYLDHPYRHPVIGYRQRLNAVTRDDLLKYYERMYVPNRMVIAVAGGIEEEKAVAAVEREFRDFRPPDYREVLERTEPAQIARRRARETCPTAVSYMAMAFHSTSLLDKDLFAMDILAAILGRGDESRLNRALRKEKRLVYAIDSWNYTTRAPGLFLVTAMLDGANLDKAEEGVMAEIEKIREGAIGDAEIAAARRMVLADYIFSRETIEGQAEDAALSEILTGAPDFSRRYVDGIQAVTKEDIKNAANEYLKEGNLTTVYLVPPSLGEAKAPPAKGVTRKETVVKEVLPNGLTLILREDDKTPTASIAVAFSGGLLAERKSDNGISNLTATMLLKGTRKRRDDEIEAAVERRGGSIRAFSGFNSFGLTASVLKDDVDFAMALVSDIVTDSTIPADLLEREKDLVFAMIREEDNDIFQNGLRVLRRDLFGTHPYGMRYLGEEATVKALGREEVMGFYKRHCIPNNMVLSISGDIASGPLLNRLKELFGGMKKAVPPEISPENIEPALKRRDAVTMDKEESLIMFGFRTVGMKDPDRYAFEVISSILSGYSGRLFGKVRNRLSLAYSLGCAQKFGIDTGYLVLYVATTSEGIEKARPALNEEMELLRSARIGREELAGAKRELITDHMIKLETNEFIALQGALDELYGLGYEESYRYQENIEKVSAEDLKRIANKYLDMNASVEVTITPK